MLPRVAVTVGALALMFGFGSLWTGSGRAELPAAERAVGIRSSLPSTGASASVAPVEQNRPQVPASNVETAEQVRSDPSGTAVGENADKYFCGALTKKGTPCSRKVKAKGLRCFQHEGRTAAPES